MVPEAAVSNPPRSSRRCSSPSTVDSAARRACRSSRAQHYREAERLLEALPPDKRGDSLSMKAPVLTLEEVQVHTILATVHDDAYSV